MKKLTLTVLLSTFSFSTFASNFDAIVGKYAHYDVVSYVGELFGPVKLKSRIISFGITEFYVEDDYTEIVK